MNDLRKYLSTCLLATAALLVGASPAWAQVSLGTASDFAVLGGTAVTCTSSLVLGDVGSGGAFTNTGCTSTGAMPPATDPAEATALADFLNAYAGIQSQSTSCIQMPGNLAGKNLSPGVYCLDAVAKAGTLTLTGNATDQWIFLVNGALTGTNFTVVMAGGGQPCNVFWAPSAAATMTTSAFKGNILAGGATGSITLTGGSVAGRVMANVAVTMTNSVIGCSVPSALSGTSSCKDEDHDWDKDKDYKKCNQGVGNGHEGCDPGKSDVHWPFKSNDENGGKPGDPGRKGGKH